jgi:hypothetical protein
VHRKHSHRCSLENSSSGSSPQARGERVLIAPDKRPRRIIPACAGSTPRKLSAVSSSRDHPRVDGEQLWDLGNIHHVGGSSPRARSTRPGGHTAPLSGDHPGEPGVRGATSESVCADVSTLRGGEHVKPADYRDFYLGSPPRKRRAHLVANAGSLVVEIIPACAGNTCSLCTATSHTQDHPRLCGEHVTFPDPAGFPFGSSPDAWGARNPRAEPRLPLRIIPGTRGALELVEQRMHHPGMILACARSTPFRFADGNSSRGSTPACTGSTTSSCQWCGTALDYPRVRGEHSTLSTMLNATMGSSPRAWGGQDRQRLGAAPAGIIPACTRSTSGTSQSGTSAADHPRVHGEHPSWLGSRYHGGGLSRDNGGARPRPA